MPDGFHAAFTTMSEAIAQAHPGRDHAHWFSIFMDNLIYRPLFGKSAKQLKALYGLSRKASLCAVLPQEALVAITERMVLITQHLQEGLEYAAIKALVLSEQATAPLVLAPLPACEKGSGHKGRYARPRHRSRPMPGQLCLPGLAEEAP